MKTVDTHRGHVLKKLGLRNNSDITRFALKYGVVDVDGTILTAEQRRAALAAAATIASAVAAAKEEHALA